jgi:hypothetical protein
MKTEVEEAQKRPLGLDPGFATDPDPVTYILNTTT